LTVDGNARARRSRRHDLVRFVALGELDVVHVTLREVGASLAKISNPDLGPCY
jgi:hypothetical protein